MVNAKEREYCGRVRNYASRLDLRKRGEKYEQTSRIAETTCPRILASSLSFARNFPWGSSVQAQLQLSREHASRNLLASNV